MVSSHAMSATVDMDHDFEGWAHLAARLRERTPAEQQQILASYNLADGSWRALHERWAKKLNGEIAAGMMTRPLRYAAICAADLATRSTTKSTSGSDTLRTPRGTSRP